MFSSSLVDLKDPFFYRALVAEFLGTGFLVFIGCGSCIGKNWSDNTPTVVHIALCFGFAVATIVWCLGHISGGHVNPAVTFGMLVARKISLVRAILFIIAQCVGAVAGAYILNVLTPNPIQSNLGMTTLDPYLTPVQGFSMELIITFQLVFTVFACCDNYRTDLGGSVPLTVGISVSLCHMVAIKYTGSSMNPARTFGPAVNTGIWAHHWIYWCGPMLGGALAALCYELIFAADASREKARNFFRAKRPQSSEEEEGEAGQIPGPRYSSGRTSRPSDGTRM